MDFESVRAAVADMVSGIEAADALEAADVAGALDWLASGAPVFRTVPPDTPPRHLVSYFVPFDEASRCVLLADHVKSGLWLPPGGHAEPGEDPRDTVTREASEELGIDARFRGAGLPFFLTATPTVGLRSHVDVSLWFVLECGRGDKLAPDPREFRSVRWAGLDEDFTTGEYDPQMWRFARKLASSANSDGNL